MGSVQDIRNFLDSDILEKALEEGKLPDPHAELQDKMKVMLEAACKVRRKGDKWEVVSPDGIVLADFTEENKANDWADKRNKRMEKMPPATSEGRLPKDISKDKLEDKMKVMLETPAAVVEPDVKGAEKVAVAGSTGASAGSSGSGVAEDLKVGDKVAVEMMGGGGTGIIKGFGQQSREHVLVNYGSAGEHWTFRKFLKKVGETMTAAKEYYAKQDRIDIGAIKKANHVVIEVSGGVADVVKKVKGVAVAIVDWDQEGGEDEYVVNDFESGQVIESAADITAAMKKSMKMKGKDWRGQMIGRGVMVASLEKNESELDLFSNKALVSEADVAGFSEEGHTYTADADDLDLLIQNDQHLYKWLHDSWYKNFARKMKAGTFDPKMAAQGMLYVVKDAAKQWYQGALDWADDGKSTVVKPSKEVIQQEAESLVKDFQDWYQTEGPGSEAASAGGAGSSSPRVRPTAENLIEASQEDVRDVKEAINSLSASLSKTLQFAKETAGKLAVMNADPSILEAFRRTLHENVINTLESIQDKVVPQLNEMTESMLGATEVAGMNQGVVDKSIQVPADAAGGK